jgi:hypothetical protein
VRPYNTAGNGDSQTVRGMFPAGQARKEGLKRRRLNPTILRGLSLRVVRLREQDSNLQPCGYGRFRNFHSGPDYLITLRCAVKITGTHRRGRALVGRIGELLIP